MSIPPLPRFAATARSAVSKFAGDNAVAPPDLENLIFALGEAIANAIQHARTTEAIEIRIDVDGNAIVITVKDRGAEYRCFPAGRFRFRASLPKPAAGLRSCSAAPTFSMSPAHPERERS